MTNRVIEMEEEIQDLREKIRQIQDSCIHEIIRNTYHYYKDGEIVPGSEHPGDGIDPCPKCNYSYPFPNWWCPKSKTHMCRYAEDDYMEDQCLYCGQPRERK